MAGSQQTIKEIRGRRDLRKFVAFPFSLYSDNRNWIPPLISDEVKNLDPTQNPAFEFCRGKYWMAMRDGSCVGRIAAFINERDNEKRELRNARFALIDFIDDPVVCRVLLETAESWARTEGMTKIEGPLGLTTFDTCAVLIEGFDHLPTAVSSYNFAYYSTHIEACGYRKEIDYLEQRFELPPALDDKIRRIAGRARQRKGLSVIAPRTKRELAPHIPETLDLVNRCYSDLYEFVPLTPRQMDFLIARYLPVLDPNLVKLVTDKSGVIVGAGITLPSLSRALQAAGGKMLPLGWLRFLSAMRKNDTVDLYLIAVEPTLRHSGISAVIMSEMHSSIIEAGLFKVETNGILETNDRVFSTWKGFQPTTHKRRRIYSKNLSPTPEDHGGVV